MSIGPQASPTLIQAPERLVEHAARRTHVATQQNALDYVLAVTLGIGGLLLYIATLAPTLVWGDDATLQLAAVQGRFQASAGSHPAWTLLAHLFTKLPVGEPAYRVNLASAFAAAVTLGLVYLIARTTSASRFASFAGVVAFAVSHTFWAHAVRPEVYTLTLATLAFVIWAALQWRRSRQRRYLVLMGLGWSVAFSTHVLALLMLPALVFLLLAQRERLRRAEWTLLIGPALLALIPYAVVLYFDYQRIGGNLLSLARWALLTFNGYDFSRQMVRFSPGSLLSDGVQWAGFLAYQFIGLGLLFGGLGLWLTWRRWPRDLAVFVGLLYAAPTLFAFAYQVGDRYVFYLPSYLPFALWLAVGVDGWLSWQKTRTASRPSRHGYAVLVLVLLVLVPVGVYRFAPEVMSGLGTQYREVRYVPGPNSRTFLLWPPKANYHDARNYAEGALVSAPPNALLLADPMLASPMFFLQQVERLRPDVLVRFCCWDIEQAVAEEAGRALALADDAPSVYPIEKLQREYQIVPRGPIYLLMPLRPQASTQAATGDR